MKKNIASICFLLIGLLFLSRCKEDTGNYDYIQLPAFSIDTAGTGVLLAEQSSILSISPKINFEGKSETLSFLWRIYLQTGRGVIDTLSSKRDLAEPIARNPGLYMVELQVKESVHGITEVAVYPLEIIEQDALPAGLLVFEQTGAVTDLSLISSPTFISGNGVSERVIHELLQTYNLESLTGVPIQVQQKGREVILLTSDDMLSVGVSSFKINRHFAQFFFNAADAPSVVDPRWAITNGKAFVNGKDVYRGAGTLFNAKIILQDGKGYEAAPYLVASSYNDFFYDQLNGRYVLMTEGSIIGQPFTKKGDKSLFSPERTERKMLLGARGYPVVSDYYDEIILSSWGVFGDQVAGDRRYLMALNEGSGPLANVDISNAPDIQTAKLLRVGDKNSFCLYSNGGAIRHIQVDMVSGTSATYSDAGFAPANGEIITAMEIVKPGNTLLFVATWNEASKEGKLHLVRMNEVSGKLSTVINTWTGFGKIQAMGLKTL
ncbi:hypothetical protein SAMN05660841_00875 [Sphingobacterium nematocida]|uniref:PKD-like family protein n=1 Tax=Sphingobacterium nematocida TaxID=1513896 RepID=A0A1T5BQ11_9SPHI|nr:PKD-like family lipoprotein [Sphingobacterium nematocida]SKB49422.1 hypothetical protein SAMN05660841_00875 [Sphingobacterium nematocida]